MCLSVDARSVSPTGGRDECVRKGGKSSAGWRERRSEALPVFFFFFSLKKKIDAASPSPSFLPRPCGRLAPRLVPMHTWCPPDRTRHHLVHTLSKVGRVRNEVDPPVSATASSLFFFFSFYENATRPRP